MAFSLAFVLFAEKVSVARTAACIQLSFVIFALPPLGSALLSKLTLSISSGRDLSLGQVG